MDYLILNGKFIEGNHISISPANHSYRYGDGLFETIRVVDNSILFKEYHFNRLFEGLNVLKFTIPGYFTKQRIEEEIKELCTKNNCGRSARIRLSVSRGNGSLYDCDDDFFYLIECWPLEKNSFNENASPADRQGLHIDIFPDARKSIDVFSNLKSANYLPYVMGAVWAKENKLDEALILNQYGRICDATIANIFWVKNEKIYTTPLSEGGVAGVMRRWILDCRFQISDFGFQTSESNLSEEILLDADEVFLTNTITGIRWVKQFRDKEYGNKIAQKLYTIVMRANSV